MSSFCKSTEFARRGRRMAGIRRMVAIAFFVFVYLVAGRNGFGQSLVSAEYFWDVDPGTGLGVAVSVAAGESFVGNFNADVSALSTGSHALGLRVKDASNRWGAVNWLPVRVEDATTLGTPGPNSPPDEGARKLVAGEYFWDADSGQGAGIAVNVPAGETFAGVFSANVSQLQTGTHAVGFRVKDASGRWGEINWLPVQVEDATTLGTPGPNAPKNEAPRTLVATEYFWDEDPGNGKGTAISIQPGASVTFGAPGTNSFLADFSTVTGGLHNLGFRVKEASGAWSAVEWSPIDVPAAPIAKFDGVLHTNNVVQTSDGASFQVTLESRFAAGLIFYTVDGSDPNSGEIYSGPFTVTAPFSLRAVAVADETQEMPAVNTLNLSTPGGGGVSNTVSLDPDTGIATVSLQATPNSQWTFLGWSGDVSGLSAGTTLVMDGPKKVVGTFGTTLGATVSGSGTVLRDPDVANYPYGTVVKLSAVPNAGQYFRTWSGAQGNAFISPTLFTITNAKPSVLAVFAALPTVPTARFALTILTEGAGTVTRSPEATNYASGASVTLTAVPIPGAANHFLSWAGDVSGSVNPLTITMSASKTITAKFELDSAVNKLPVTSITAPLDGTTFTGPSSITITADASDSDGGIAQTAFLSDGSQIGVATAPTAGSSSYTFVWNSPPVGQHVLTTVATDNRGGVTTSAPVNITVNPPPNQPPTIALLAPAATDFFRSETNILIVAQATDSDGSVTRVDFYWNTTLLGSSTEKSVTNTFSFVWTNAPVGTDTIFVRATDNKGTSANTSVDIVVLPPEATSYRWEQASYSVAENAGSITLKIIKTGVEAGSVNFATVDVSSAQDGRDYRGNQGVVNFAAGENSKTVTITLLDEFVPDGDKFFDVQLTSSTDNRELGTPSVCRVTTVDNDASLADNSFLQFGIVGNRPDVRGSLRVHLEPVAAKGQWHFPWELAWRNSDDVALDLDPGEYPVTFRALANYDSPDSPLYTVPGGQTVTRTNVYTPDATVTGGALTVVFGQADLLGSATPGWRFVGDVAYHANGEKVANIAPGIQVVEFATISGWVRPLSREVLIQSGVDATVNVAYTLDSPVTGNAATPQRLANYAQIHQSQLGIPNQPYALVGQLRSVAGYGSGIAVRDHVVLTAAHVLFDENTLDYVPSVDWYGEREAGEYEPRPITARGWYVNTNYAFQRKHERIDLGLAPGVSTPASQQWDMAAIYFDDPVAHGGFSGYLLSDADANAWLISAFQKELIGYPLGANNGVDDGKMQAVSPFNYSFNQVSGRVYKTAPPSQFLSYPGNSGGPVCVLFNRIDGANIYFPAAIYLGNQSGSSIVRAIDKDTASLINRAASSAALGTNFVGGGVISLGGGGGFGTAQFVHLTIVMNPPAAVSAGAGWRLKGAAAYSASGASLLFPAGNIQIEFNAVAGFATPSVLPVTLVAGQDSTISVTYLSNATPPAQFDRIELFGGTLRLRVHRATAGTVVLERSVDLKNWTTLRNLDLPATTAADFDVVLPGDHAGYFRISSP